MRLPGLDKHDPSSDPGSVAAAVLSDAGEVDAFSEGRCSRAESSNFEQLPQPLIHARRHKTGVISDSLRALLFVHMSIYEDAYGEQCSRWYEDNYTADDPEAGCY